MTSKAPEDVFITLLRSTYRNARHSTRTILSTPPTSRQLSFIAAPRSPLRLSVRRSVAYAPAIELPRARNRAYATVSGRNGRPRQIAVLGGGITGLTTAHYLARHAQNAHITLYEGSGKLGGWVDGTLALAGNDEEHDTILLQHGPRMLRTGSTALTYNDLVLYDVLASLNIQDQLQPQRFEHPLSRYIYYPDHLVRLPELNRRLGLFSAARSLLTEPLWDGTPKALWNFIRNMSGRRPFEGVWPDESAGHFIEGIIRDDRPVKNLVSAIYHGIYGGDVYKLSVNHTILRNLWRHAHLPRHGRPYSWVDMKDIHLLNDIMSGPNGPEVSRIADRLVGFSTMAFEDGLLSIVTGLAKDLEAQKNVTIKKNSRVTSLALANNKHQVLVTTADEAARAKHYDQVISTLFSKQLAQLAKPKDLSALADTHAVTIMVVNLWFPNAEILGNTHGFGYLVPTSTPGNDEAVLGVLFDSDLRMSSEIGGTKLTVMLGGHYWDHLTEYPSEDAGVAMAIQAVRRHLGIDPHERVHGVARLCRDCLPQHHVGHSQRMKEAHYQLHNAFQGRVTVAGPSYTDVGVMQAMRAGFDAAMRVALGHGPPFFANPEASAQNIPLIDRIGSTSDYVDHVGATGLEGFAIHDGNDLGCVSTERLPFKASFKGPDSKITGSRDGDGDKR